MADEKIEIEIELDVDKRKATLAFKDLENVAVRSGSKAGASFARSAGSQISGSFKSVFGSVFGRLSGQIAALGTALGAAFAARGVLRAGETIERIETQFGTLLGSAQAAQRQIEELTTFAAQTPFQLEGLAQASAQLLSFGFESDTLIDRLKVIGDVAAGSNSELKDVALIFGQVSAAGKLTGERLLQLQERAIPIGSALAKTLGVAESEVRGLVSAGKVGFKEFEDAFRSLTQEGGLFQNATAKQSQTIGGLLSTLRDNFFALQVAVARAFGPIFKRLVQEAINVVQALTKNFQNNSKNIVNSAINVGRAINDFVVPAFAGLARAGEFAFRALVVGGNTIVAVIGKIGEGLGRILQFAGFGDELAQSLITFGESSAIVLEESIKPLEEATNNLFDPIAFQEKTEVFLTELQSFSDSAGAIAEGTVKKFDKTQKQIVKTTQNTGKQLANIINQALVQTTSKGIQELTKSLFLGGEGFKNFGKFVLGTLGDLSIKLGESLILTGIGIESLKALSGAAAIAAGAGLIALGTILKGISGGEGGLAGAPSGAGAGGFGGGLGAVGSDEFITEQQEEREEPETRVAITVNGDIFDSDETGTRLVQILNNSFEQDGVVVTNGAFA